MVMVPMNQQEPRERFCVWRGESDRTQHVINSLLLFWQEGFSLIAHLIDFGPLE